MRILVSAIALLLCVPEVAVAETRSIEFVQTFVRTIGDVEQARDDGKADGASLTGCIHSMESLQLALAAGVNLMTPMRLSGKDVREVPATFAKQFVLLGEMYDALGKVCAQVLVAKTSSDVAPLTAKVPKIRADIEFTWKTIENGAPLVFATLISDTPDSAGHMSQLNITRAERDELVHLINSQFARKFANTKQIDDVASIAWIIRDYLTKKGYRCSDE